MPRVLLLTVATDTSDARSAALEAARHILPERHAVTHLDLFASVQPEASNGAAITLRHWRRLRCTMRTLAPDLIHAVGHRAWILAAYACRGVPLIVSELDQEALGICGRIALRSTDVRLVHSRHEAETCRDSTVKLFPYGVASEHTTPGGADTKSSGKPRTILFGGSLDSASLPMEAAWAFDVLKYTDPGLQLVFVGDGPMRGRVERLSRSLGFDDHRVRFAAGGELDAWRRRASVVWLTQRRGGGYRALVSLAHGLPVIAMRTDELDEYQSESEGLVLVGSGDRVGLAAATKRLLNGPAPICPAGRFPLEPMVEGFAATYDALANESVAPSVSRSEIMKCPTQPSSAKS